MAYLVLRLRRGQSPLQWLSFGDCANDMLSDSARSAAARLPIRVYFWTAGDECITDSCRVPREVAKMRKELMRFPIRCPVCDTELISYFRTSQLATALREGRPIRLFAICHDQAWRASEIELEQMREYLRALVPR